MIVAQFPPSLPSSPYAVPEDPYFALRRSTVEIAAPAFSSALTPQPTARTLAALHVARLYPDTGSEQASASTDGIGCRDVDLGFGKFGKVVYEGSHPVLAFNDKGLLRAYDSPSCRLCCGLKRPLCQTRQSRSAPASLLEKRIDPERVRDRHDAYPSSLMPHPKDLAVSIGGQ